MATPKQAPTKRQGTSECPVRIHVAVPINAPEIPPPTNARRQLGLLLMGREDRTHLRPPNTVATVMGPRAGWLS